MQHVLKKQSTANVAASGVSLMHAMGAFSLSGSLNRHYSNRYLVIVMWMFGRSGSGWIDHRATNKLRASAQRPCDRGFFRVRLVRVEEAHLVCLLRYAKQAMDLSACRFRSAADLVTMGKEPENIIKLKRHNDMYSAAEHHAHNLQVATTTAQWFANDFCKPPNSGAVPNTKNLVGKETSIIERYKVSAVDKMVQELGAANDVVKMQRRAQLRELLTAERAQYERELNAMGLAFHKLVN